MALTAWQLVQWGVAAVGAISGCVSIGWVLTQGRKLHREERARQETEDELLQLIDSLRQRGGTSYVEVPSELRRAALLGREWKALDVMWDRGAMQARLATFGDHFA
jgi:hypothetical protein